MLRSILIALVFVCGGIASATTINMEFAQTLQRAFLSDDFSAQGLNFREGDQTTYNMDMAGFIKGSMIMTVKSVQPDQAVITQDIDLGFLGKQSCETTMNPNTGEIQKMVCNGQEQQKPDAGDMEVIDTKEDTVKVPAGTFTCLYIKVKNKKDNTEAEQWVSPKQVPVYGMVKMKTQSQMGQVNVELKSFKKN